MTPSQLDHLRAIDAHLARLLEIAKKRTPGRWKTRKGSRHGCDVETDHHAVAQCDFCGDSEDESNADFIASCAGNAEAGWEGARILIAEFLSIRERMEKMGCPEFACGPLEKLLAQWPLELLANG